MCKTQSPRVHEINDQIAPAIRLNLIKERVNLWQGLDSTIVSDGHRKVVEMNLGLGSPLTSKKKAGAIARPGPSLI
jgi:hypothetical protein